MPSFQGQNNYKVLTEKFGYTKNPTNHDFIGSRIMYEQLLDPDSGYASYQIEALEEQGYNAYIKITEREELPENLTNTLRELFSVTGVEMPTYINIVEDPYMSHLAFDELISDVASASLSKAGAEDRLLSMIRIQQKQYAFNKLTVENFLQSRGFNEDELKALSESHKEDRLEKYKELAAEKGLE